jgi:hypothetical protein
VGRLKLKTPNKKKRSAGANPPSWWIWVFRLSAQIQHALREVPKNRALQEVRGSLKLGGRPGVPELFPRARNRYNPPKFERDPFRKPVTTFRGHPLLAQSGHSFALS